MLAQVPYNTADVRGKRADNLHRHEALGRRLQREAERDETKGQHCARSHKDFEEGTEDCSHTGALHDREMLMVHNVALSSGKGVNLLFAADSQGQLRYTPGLKPVWTAPEASLPS